MNDDQRLASSGPPPRWAVSVLGHERTFRCAEDQTVLKAMHGQGLRLLDVGCRGGGCGVCRVKVTSGQYRTGAMSRLHINDEDRDNDVALSCRVYPQSDLVVAAEPIPDRSSRNSSQRSSATGGQ
ncbi:MAG: 2Fe-2S iron-sulfur cluster-binding protein [Acidimicrobiia bacterium]